MHVRQKGVMMQVVYDLDKDGQIALAQLVGAVCSEDEADGKITTHKNAATGVHGVGASTVCSETELANAIAAHSAVKVIRESRDLAAESGDVSYTGYGFQPTGLIVVAWLANLGSIGGSEPARTGKCLWLDYEAASHIETYLIFLEVDAGKEQYATVSSYDEDGFTLSWTKTGEPTLTAGFIVFAFK